MHYSTKIIAAALLLFNSAWVLAAPSAQELVQQTADRMIAAIKSERAVINENPEHLYALVDEIILPHFDFERMSSWVLGKHWRAATPEQRTHFTQEFRTLLVRTYATAMGEYSDQKITYPPMKAAPDATEVTVRSEIEQPGGPSIPINYNLFLKNGNWKVQDVVIDNTSLVANYRSSFSSEIRRDGLDALIDKLAARNQQKN
ncbi:MAG: ABC transporter substrate-binding protein [Gammaproteobacteria bacterium]